MIDHVEFVIDSAGTVHLRQRGLTVCGVEFFDREIVQTVERLPVDCETCELEVMRIMNQAYMEAALSFPSALLSQGPS